MKALHPLLSAAFLLIGLCSPVQASAMDQLDVSVGLKVLPLLTSKITGAAIAAIIYDPSNAESQADADATKAVIDGGIEAPGGVKLTSVLVGVGELGKLSGAKIAFVTHGLPTTGLDAVSKAAAESGILTISTDIDYVKSNKCILGVVSSPSVKIYYSKAAADLGKISFAQAFTMLVTQI